LYYKGLRSQQARSRNSFKDVANVIMKTGPLIRYISNKGAGKLYKHLLRVFRRNLFTYGIIYNKKTFSWLTRAKKQDELNLRYVAQFRYLVNL